MNHTHEQRMEWLLSLMRLGSLETIVEMGERVVQRTKHNDWDRNMKTIEEMDSHYIGGVRSLITGQGSNLISWKRYSIVNFVFSSSHSHPTWWPFGLSWIVHVQVCCLSYTSTAHKERRSRSYDCIACYDDHMRRKGMKAEEVDDRFTWGKYCCGLQAICHFSFQMEWKADAVTCHPLLTMMMTATRGRLNDVLIEIFDKGCTEASGWGMSYRRERVCICIWMCVCQQNSYRLMTFSRSFPSLLFNQTESLITSSSFSRECMN